jgi:peptidoglycan/xylan/chitin deacetylase (PgdA/CDA1 family)
MQLMQQGRYAEQWPLLSGLAQQRWPSAAARSAMLTTKFSGINLTADLGEPTQGASWTDPERLVSIPSLWQVPVSVSLNGPVNPPDVVPFYRQQALYLSVIDGRSRGVSGPLAEVVGEGPAALDAPVLLPAAGSARTVAVPILMYHEVGPYPTPSQYPGDSYGYQLEYGLTVDPQEFSRQMEWLASGQYRPISLPRLADALYYGLPLPPRPVILTFDDALRSPLVNAVPILQQYGFTANFFIPTGLVGWHSKTRWYMSWDEIAALGKQGFWLQDHTRNHVSVYGLPTQELEVQIAESRQEIQQLTGQPCQFFAYPGSWPFRQATTAAGAEQVDFSFLQAHGYVGAVVDQADLSIAVRGGQPYQIPRVRVDPGETLAGFAAGLGGE